MMTLKEETKQRAVMTLAHHDYQKGLNTRAFFKIHDHAVGEDLVQETSTKTWCYLVRGGKIEMMKAFLYHVLNQLIVDEYRKRKATSLDVMVKNGFEPAIEDFAHIFNVMDGAAALLLIAQLPIKYQKVMRMKYKQDLSLTEISLLTGQSRNTIAVQTHRGMAKLKLLYRS